MSALVWRLALVVVLCGSGGGAVAQITPAGPAVEVLGSNSWRVLQPTSISAIPASARTVTGSATGLLVKDALTIAGRAGPLAVQVARTAAWDVVGAAVGRCLASGPAVALCTGASAAAYLAYDKYRVRPAATETGLGFDPGVLPGTSAATCMRNANSGTAPSLSTCYPSLAAAGGADCAAYVSGGTASVLGGIRNEVKCSYSNPNPNSITWAYNASAGQVQSCPPIVDFSDPRYSVPASVVGPDGKCPTGRYSDPVTPEQAWAKVGVPPVADHGRWTQAAKDALASGKQIGASPVDTPMSLTGPASQTGTGTTTTTAKPDGTVSTETKTPSYNYTYVGDTINVSTSYVTVTNNNGQTTTTTTNNAPEEGKTDCEKFPDAVGCAKLGEVPGDKPTWKDKTIDYSPESLGFTGSCPAPGSMTLPYLGKTLAWSYQPACDIAPIIRLGILALTALGALIFIVGTVKT